MTYSTKNVAFRRGQSTYWDLNAIFIIIKRTVKEGRGGDGRGSKARGTLYRTWSSAERMNGGKGRERSAGACYTVRGPGCFPTQHIPPNLPALLVVSTGAVCDVSLCTSFRLFPGNVWRMVQSAGGCQRRHIEEGSEITKSGASDVAEGGSGGDRKRNLGGTQLFSGYEKHRRPIRSGASDVAAGNTGAQPEWHKRWGAGGGAGGSRKQEANAQKQRAADLCRAANAEQRAAHAEQLLPSRRDTQVAWGCKIR
ncbi:hypothetical protein FIBSPDRAFT_924830 [Athelia psychrophila]|uniref:Uncharacterized protein n=1 Tax=Athelia psychrophila TaxID=1759441 RepID=A0A166VHY8_9AGAM|nr:hypothetical protein FIBSPDRAFT_924830 [Fibularhizoctonia sp. CBS 109695]